MKHPQKAIYLNKFKRQNHIHIETHLFLIILMVALYPYKIFLKDTPKGCGVFHARSLNNNHDAGDQQTSSACLNFKYKLQMLQTCLIRGVYRLFREENQQDHIHFQRSP